MQQKQVKGEKLKVKTEKYGILFMSFWAKRSGVEESPRYVFVVNGAPYEEIPRLHSGWHL